MCLDLTIKWYDWDSVIFEENWRRFSRPIEDIVNEVEKPPSRISRDVRETIKEEFRLKYSRLPLEKRRIIDELYGWVEWIFAQSKQWNVGNCYFLAALDSMKYSSDFIDIITKVFRKTSEWWEVTFLWLKPPNNKTVITNRDMNKTVEYYDWTVIKLFSDSTQADKILERAYWRFRQHRLNYPDSKEIPHHWSNNTVAVYWDRETSHWWWNMVEVTENLFWYKSVKYPLPLSTNMQSWVRHALTETVKKNCSIILWTTGIWDDTETFILNTFEWAVSLYKSHAYSAIYDPSRDIVTIINPHDTLNQRYTLKLADLLWNKNFFGISIWTPR